MKNKDARSLIIIIIINNYYNKESLNVLCKIIVQNEADRGSTQTPKRAFAPL